MGFASLQHIKVRKSTLRGLATPASFRPQGLATLAAAYSFRARAGLVSYRRRSWDSPCGASSSRKVSDAFPPGSTHMPFLPSLFPSAIADRPAQRTAASGFQPFRESLTTSVGLGRPSSAAPLGFTLLGHLGDRLARDFARTPLPRLATTSLTACCRRRLRVSINHRLVPPAARRTARTGETALLGFRRLYASEHSGGASSGLCVHLTSRRALPPTGRLSWDDGLALPELLGII